MGILSSLGNAVDKAEEMLGFDKKEEEVKPPENAVTADLGSSIDMAQLHHNEPTESVANTAQVYTVQSGDTLSKISQRYYGNSHDYMKIFNANKDKLDDPDKIQVGQELTIPNE
jgi:nucleoid-associated protein YgaU